MITEEEVRHIIKLARLGLREEEIKVFQKELFSILNYFKKLEELDVSEVSPTSYSVETENVMREDIVEESEVARQKLMDLAPETKEGYFKVRSIFNR